MPGDVGSSMGVGGSGGIFSRKTELVADLTSAFKTLNAELEKTKKLSEDISRNLKTARGGSGNTIFSTANTSTGTKDPVQNDGSQTSTTSGGGFNIGGFLKGLLSVGGKLAGAGLQAMPTLQEVFMQNASASMAGFVGGRGVGFGAQQQMSLARNGIFGSAEDVYAAQNVMSQNAMQGKNSAVFQANVSAMSNLVPTGNGAQAAQAVAALNQGKNVNMLRMIGVNVRGADGMMRNFKDIAKDLWNTLNRQKQGGGGIKKDDILFSLQPGNALDSMMNQYFGNDPVLRQGVVNELLLLAGGGSGNIQKDARSQGLVTGAMASQASKVASQVNVQQAAAQYELKGMIEANKALATLNNRFAGLIEKSRTLQKILEGKGFLDTMAGAGHGAGSAVLGMAGAGLLGVGKWGFGKLKGLFGGGGGAAAAAEGEAAAASGGWLSKIGGLKGAAGRLFSGAAVYGGMEWLQGLLNKADVPDWVRNSGNFAFDLGEGALTGLAVGKNPYSALAGMVAGGYGAVTNPYKKKGTGGGEDGLEPSKVSMPLNNNPPITSPFGKVRHIITHGGRHNASWGKPHGGVDYGVGEGTPVYAVKDGVVQETPYDSNGFGNYVKILHEDGKLSYYGHLSSMTAKSNTKVSAGDLVGYSGDTGNSSGPHLHFEVREGGQSIDPLDYLAGATDSGGKDGAHPLKRNVYKITGGAGDLMAPPMGGEGDVPATTFSNVKSVGSARSERSINYGGVTITMNFPAGNYNKEEIKAAVREVLSYDNIRKHAVTK